MCSKSHHTFYCDHNFTYTVELAMVGKYRVELTVVGKIVCKQGKET